jgi:uncharacterized membrane protein YciS (DUF1049 family)
MKPARSIVLSMRLPVESGVCGWCVCQFPHFRFKINNLSSSRHLQTINNQVPSLQMLMRELSNLYPIIFIQRLTPT